MSRMIRSVNGPFVNGPRMRSRRPSWWRRVLNEWRDAYRRAVDTKAVHAGLPALSIDEIRAIESELSTEELEGINRRRHAQGLPAVDKNGAVQAGVPFEFHAAACVACMEEKRSRIEPAMRCAQHSVDMIAALQLQLEDMREQRDAIMRQVPSETTGVGLIFAERRRQIYREGWTPAHDDTHRRGQMARAAACYALADLEVKHRPRWPWARTWWKPTQRVTNLVKAGALVAAEIDRLIRLRNVVRPSSQKPRAGCDCDAADTIAT